MRYGIALIPVVAILGLTACEPLDTADTVTTTTVAAPIRDGICTPRVVQGAPGMPPQTIMDDPDCMVPPPAPIQTVASYSSEPLITISGDVAFDTNSATIKSEFRNELNSIADQLLSSGGSDFTIVGHTDIRGSAEYNQDLSERRARSVANYLISRGVPRDSLTVRGEGESNPIDSGTSAEAHRRNRRVEIIGSGGGGYTSGYTTSYPATYPAGTYPAGGYGTYGYSYQQAAPRYAYPATGTGVVPGQVVASPQTVTYTQQSYGGYVAPSYGTTVVTPQPTYDTYGTTQYGTYPAYGTTQYSTYPAYGTTGQPAYTPYPAYPQQQVVQTTTTTTGSGFNFPNSNNR